MLCKKDLCEKPRCPQDLGSPNRSVANAQLFPVNAPARAHRGLWAQFWMLYVFGVRPRNVARLAILFVRMCRHAFFRIPGGLVSTYACVVPE